MGNGRVRDDSPIEPEGLRSLTATAAALFSASSLRRMASIISCAAAWERFSVSYMEASVLRGVSRALPQRGRLSRSFLAHPRRPGPAGIRQGAHNLFLLAGGGGPVYPRA